MSKESLKDVSTKFQGCCFKKVSGVSLGRWMGVSRVSRKNSKGVSWKFLGVTRMLQVMFKRV